MFCKMLWVNTGIKIKICTFQFNICSNEHQKMKMEVTLQWIDEPKSNYYSYIIDSLEWGKLLIFALFFFDSALKSQGNLWMEEEETGLKKTNSFGSYSLYLCFLQCNRQTLAKPWPYYSYRVEFKMSFQLKTTLKTEPFEWRPKYLDKSNMYGS